MHIEMLIKKDFRLHRKTKHSRSIYLVFICCTLLQFTFVYQKLSDIFIQCKKRLFNTQDCLAILDVETCSLVRHFIHMSLWQVWGAQQNVSVFSIYKALHMDIDMDIVQDEWRHQTNSLKKIYLFLESNAFAMTKKTCDALAAIDGLNKRIQAFIFFTRYGDKSETDIGCNSLLAKWTTHVLTSRTTKPF